MGKTYRTTGGSGHASGEYARRYGSHGPRRAPRSWAYCVGGRAMRAAQKKRGSGPFRPRAAGGGGSRQGNWLET